MATDGIQRVRIKIQVHKQQIHVHALVICVSNYPDITQTKNRNYGVRKVIIGLDNLHTSKNTTQRNPGFPLCR